MQLNDRHINDYIDDPSLVGDLPLDAIEKAVADCPWAPELRAIHARKLFLLKDKSYEDVLATASLYSDDRASLKQYLESDLEGKNRISKKLKSAARTAAGVQESKNAGERESGNAGMQDRKSVGEQESGNVGEQDDRNAGEQESRNAGMQDRKSVGEQESRNAGMQEGDAKRESTEQVEKEKKPRKKTTKKKEIKIAPLDTEEKANIEEEVNLEAAKTAHQESKIRDLDTSGTDSFLGWLSKVSGDIKAADQKEKEKGAEGEQESRNAGVQEGIAELANRQIGKLANSDIDSTIEKFIAAQQSLRGKNPEELAGEAEQSVEEDLKEEIEMASEGLAKLLAAQGKTEKAIAMYKKLQLKYPEKSTFFAARIKDIQKNAS